MNSAAHPVKAGFNQSGGAYFIVMTQLDNTHLNKVTAAGSNSGGAFVPPTLALAAANDAAIGLVAGEVAPGKLLKDMGKTIVSSGRTFRKFAAAGTGNNRYASSFGVAGLPPVAPNAGYGSFYLEVGREGSAGAAAVPAPVARYF